MNPQDAPRLAGNEYEPVVIEADDVGQQNTCKHSELQKLKEMQNIRKHMRSHQSFEGCFKQYSTP